MDHTTSLSDVVVGNKAKGIETIEDLKGKTVAVSSGTSSEIILEQALARAGMTMDDINTVEMTVDGMTTAMISGQIDAAASWSPIPSPCRTLWATTTWIWAPTPTSWTAPSSLQLHLYP